MYYSMKRKYTGKIALALASVLMLAGCGNAEAVSTEVADVRVDMQQADVGSLTLQSSFVGTVSPQELVYVIPFASGTITEVNYNVGDYVNAGDVLFKIDDEGARMQLEQARLSATSARQQVDMATGSQQESTDLQLESAQIQARSGYEQAQIAYFQVKGAYEELEDAVDKFEGLVNAFASVKNNKTQFDAMAEEMKKYLTKSDSFDPSTAKSEAILAQAQAQLTSMQTQRNSLRDSYRQATSAYHAAEEGLKISEESASLAQGKIREDTAAQAQTSLQLAQLGVESAELALSYYTVTAPISGVIQSRSVEVNGIAGQSSPAFVIANENSMQVTFSVSESVKSTFKVGDAITVERNGQNFQGTITEVGIAVNQQTGLFQVKANVAAGGDELPTGVSVKLTADTYSVDNTILIPYDAVYYDNTGSYVYLCIDNKAVKTYVATGIFDDTTIAITDGISKGDLVITSWSPRLLDGVSVVASDTVGK